MKQIKEVKLHNTEGTSDKMYVVTILVDPETKTFDLKTAWGRRGQKLKFMMKLEGASLASHVDVVFDDAVSKKKKRGYDEVARDGISAQQWLAQHGKQSKPSEVLEPSAEPGEVKTPKRRGFWEM